MAPQIAQRLAPHRRRRLRVPDGCKRLLAGLGAQPRGRPQAGAPGLLVLHQLLLRHAVGTSATAASGLGVIPRRVPHRLAHRRGQLDVARGASDPGRLGPGLGLLRGQQLHQGRHRARLAPHQPTPQTPPHRTLLDLRQPRHQGRRVAVLRQKSRRRTTHVMEPAAQRQQADAGALRGEQAGERIQGRPAQAEIGVFQHLRERRLGGRVPQQSELLHRLASCSHLVVAVARHALQHGPTAVVPGLAQPDQRLLAHRRTALQRQPLHRLPHPLLLLGLFQVGQHTAQGHGRRRGEVAILLGDLGPRIHQRLQLLQRAPISEKAQGHAGPLALRVLSGLEHQHQRLERLRSATQRHPGRGGQHQLAPAAAQRIHQRIDRGALDIFGAEGLRLAGLHPHGLLPIPHQARQELLGPAMVQVAQHLHRLLPQLHVLRRHGLAQIAQGQRFVVALAPRSVGVDPGAGPTIDGDGDQRAQRLLAHRRIVVREQSEEHALRRRVTDPRQRIDQRRPRRRLVRVVLQAPRDHLGRGRRRVTVAGQRHQRLQRRGQHRTLLRAQQRRQHVHGAGVAPASQGRRRLQPQVLVVALHRPTQRLVHPWILRLHLQQSMHHRGSHVRVLASQRQQPRLHAALVEQLR